MTLRDAATGILLLLILLAASGCAGLSFGDDDDMNESMNLSKFTSRDLEMALQSAVEAGDQAGMMCWQTLIGLLHTAQPEKTQIVGLATLHQAKRNLLTNEGPSDRAKQVNLGCAAMFNSDLVTLGKLVRRLKP